MNKQPDLDRLNSWLITSGLQQKNPPLFQVISGLINAVRQFQNAINGDIINISNTVNNIIINEKNKGNILQLMMNDNYSPEPDIFMIGSQSGSSEFVEWSVLTNGDPVSPELIFAGGDVIMVHVP